MKQTVAHKKLGNLQGFLVVLGLLAAILLLNFIIEIVGRSIGSTAATISFWAIGILIVLWVYRTYIVTYEYQLDADVLHISRKYGKRERPIENIYLHRVQFVGTPEDARKRFPQLKKVSAVHSRCNIPVTAVVYKNSERTCMALLQANDEIKTRLIAQAKENR